MTVAAAGVADLTVAVDGRGAALGLAGASVVGRRTDELRPAEGRVAVTVVGFVVGATGLRAVGAEVVLGAALADPAPNVPELSTWPRETVSNDGWRKMTWIAHFFHDWRRRLYAGRRLRRHRRLARARCRFGSCSGFLGRWLGIFLRGCGVVGGGGLVVR